MRRFHYFIPIFLQKIGYSLFFLLYKFFVRIEIRGKENLKGVDGPVILASNHTSELDVTAIPLVLSFFSSFYPIYFVANQDEKYKTFGWRGYIYGGRFFNMLGGYSTFSGHKNYAVSLDNFILLLRKRRTVCIFPEGKRTRDGLMNPARGGLGYLVYATGAPVIPIAIDTFFNISAWDFFTRQRKVVITILRPMYEKELMQPQNSNRPTVEEFRSAGQKVLDEIRKVMN